MFEKEIGISEEVRYVEGKLSSGHGSDTGEEAPRSERSSLSGMKTDIGRQTGCCKNVDSRSSVQHKEGSQISQKAHVRRER